MKIEEFREWLIYRVNLFREDGMFELANEIDNKILPKFNSLFKWKKPGELIKNDTEVLIKFQRETMREPQTVPGYYSNGIFYLYRTSGEAVAINSEDIVGYMEIG